MTKDEILSFIRKRYQTVSAFAGHFGVAREMVYQAVSGRGSRALRIELARLLGKRPSEIWPSEGKARLLDDKQYGLDLSASQAADLMGSPWLTFDEALIYLRFSTPKTLQNMMSKRQVPFVKEPVSGLVRFNREQLDEWLHKGAR